MTDEPDFTKAQLRRQRNTARAVAGTFLRRAQKAEHAIRLLRERLDDALAGNEALSCPPEVIPMWCDDCGEVAIELAYQENRDRTVCPRCTRPTDPVQPMQPYHEQHRIAQ
jgi:hypothetical protein